MSKQENNLSVRGFIYKIYDTVTFESGFFKREFVLETRETGADGKLYKNLTKFETLKSFSQILENIGQGSEVVATFGLAGREWTPPDGGEPKIINALRCWKIDIINNTNQDVQQTKEQAVAVEDDGLPF